MNYALNKEILRLSVPAILTNVTVPLLGLCDTAVSGHLGSEMYLAAIAVGSTMLNVVFWLFGFLRMGTTGLVATAYGRGDDRDLCRLFTQSVSLAVGIGIALAILSPLVLALMLKVVGAEPGVEKLVSQYFTICIYEAPALLGTMAVTGWFVGMQSTLWPMVIAISVNVVNIILSLTFVFGLKWGFIGTAWGTFSANWLGFALALICAKHFRKGKSLWSNPFKVWSKGGAGKFFSVNGNLFFRSFCITAVSLGVTAAGGRLGSHTLAVNAVLMQFFTLFSFFMDGFAFSAEALVGRFNGAGNTAMLKRSIRRLLLWSAGVAAVFTLAYWLGGGVLTSMLTDDFDVRQGVSAMEAVLVALPGVAVWAFIYDGFFIGLTRTRNMLVATLVATAAFFLFTFVRIGGTPGSGILETGIEFGVGSNMMIWEGFLSYLALRGLLLAFSLKK